MRGPEWRARSAQDSARQAGAQDLAEGDIGHAQQLASRGDDLQHRQRPVLGGLRHRDVLHRVVNAQSPLPGAFGNRDAHGVHPISPKQTDRAERRSGKTSHVWRLRLGQMNRKIGRPPWRGARSGDPGRIRT